MEGCSPQSQFCALTRHSVLSSLSPSPHRHQQYLPPPLYPRPPPHLLSTDSRPRCRGRRPSPRLLPRPLGAGQHQLSTITTSTMGTQTHPPKPTDSPSLMTATTPWLPITCAYVTSSHARGNNAPSCSPNSWRQSARSRKWSRC